jgi:hypothetical protein
MYTIWFKKWGWTYLPVHVMGFLVTLFALIFLAPIYAAIIRNAHSVSDDLYQMFVYTTCTAFWWKWIASKTSAGNRPEE